MSINIVAKWYFIYKEKILISNNPIYSLSTQKITSLNFFSRAKPIHIKLANISLGI